MTPRQLSAVEQRRYDKALKEQRLDRVIDRLEKFLDAVVLDTAVTETVTDGMAHSDAGSPNSPDLDAVLEELVLNQQLRPDQMRKLIMAVRKEKAETPVNEIPR